ncbi:hypothetical protein [Streptomyces sp. NPDC018031]|uniref:hypothetical protein n=1 Tax=Streptomyces sp. NPDC018031 TaxID=3365033 RepID=UPI0037A8A165
MTAALALGAGLLGSAGPAVAAPTADTPAAMPSVTVPGERMALPRSSGIVAADGTGYLSSREARFPHGPLLWVADDGRRVENLPPTRAFNGGHGLEQVPGTGSFRIRHYATGDTVRFDLPATDTVTGIFAADRLVTLRRADGRNTLHLWEVPAGGGAPVDRPIGGVPDDMGPAVYTPASDSRGAAFWWKPVGGGAWRTALLDFASARVTLIPSDDFGVLEYPRLSADKVVFMAVDKKFDVANAYVVDRAHPERPGTSITSLDGVRDWHTEMAVVGDWLVYVKPDDSKGTVRAVPLGGGQARTLLDRSRGVFVTAEDGSLLVEGGSDATRWAVHRVTPGADGAPTTATRVALPPMSAWEVGGFAVDQGRLLLAEEDTQGTEPYPGTRLFGADLTLPADGAPTASTPADLGDLGYWVPGDDSGDPGSSGYYQSCYGPCLRLTGNGEGTVLHEQHDVPDVVAASGPYSVVRYHETRQEIRNGTKVLRRTGVQAAALWGNTLWTPGGTPGTVNAVSLPSLAPAGSERIGAPCTPQELQVVGRWIYWSCGPGQDAGVHDRTTGRAIDVPGGYAQLADGYLVSQDDRARKLMITYFPGAVPEDRAGTRELAPLPFAMHAPEDRRGRYWAVDRFGGPVAYLDAAGNAVVTWPKVTTSALAVIATSAPAKLNTSAGTGWRGGWHTSKPTSGWKLTLTRTGDSTVLRTFTGGRTRGRIAVTWDGKANGTKVKPGTYRWTLTARPTDRTRPVVTSGVVTVHTG